VLRLVVLRLVVLRLVVLRLAVCLLNITYHPRSRTDARHLRTRRARLAGNSQDDAQHVSRFRRVTGKYEPLFLVARLEGFGKR
jgi:hypothetical protein